MDTKETDTTKNINWMKKHQANKKKIAELAEPAAAPIKAKAAAQALLDTQIFLSTIPPRTKVAFVAGQEISAMPLGPDGSPIPPEILAQMQMQQQQQMQSPGSAHMQGGMPPMDPSMMQGGMPPMDPSMQGGQAFVDPQTGMMMDPATGMLIDPNTGAMFDPSTGQQIDPNTGQPMEGSPEGEEGEAGEVTEKRLSSLEKQIGDLTDLVANMQDGAEPAAVKSANEAEQAGSQPAGAPLTGQATRDALSKLRFGASATNPDSLARLMANMRKPV